MTDQSLPPTAVPRSETVRPARRRWLLIALLVVISIGGIGYALYHRSALEPPALAVQDGADKEVLAAIEEGRTRVRADRLSATAWGDLGMLFGAHGYEPESERCFAEAERLAPSDPRWPYYLSLFATVHEPDRVILHLRRALANGPKPDEARVAVRLRLAEKLIDEQSLDEAEAICREEIDRAPADSHAHFLMGQVALFRGNQALAQAEFAAAAASSFARKRATVQLAALARAAGDPQAANRCEATAHGLPDDPDWPDPYLRKLRLKEVGFQAVLREVNRLEAVRQFPEAIAMLQDIIREKPTPRVLTAAAIDFAKMKQYPQAEGLLRECVRLDPRHSQGNYFLSMVLFEQAIQSPARSEFDRRSLLTEAVRYGRTAVETKPDNGLAWLYLGRALLEMGRSAEAVEALREAVACRSEMLEPHLYLGEALLAAGDKAGARRAAENAAKLAKPDDVRPRQLFERIDPSKSKS